MTDADTRPPADRPPASQLRVLTNRITKLEDELEASTAERNQLALAVDALEYRVRDLEVRVMRLDGMAVGEATKD